MRFVRRIFEPTTRTYLQRVLSMRDVLLTLDDHFRLLPVYILRDIEEFETKLW